MFHARAFYLPQSLKGNKAIGCIVFSTSQWHKADRVCQRLRKAVYYGWSSQNVLYFIHREQEQI